jgi:hypothetical protein
MTGRIAGVHPSAVSRCERAAYQGRRYGTRFETIRGCVALEVSPDLILRQ